MTAVWAQSFDQVAPKPLPPNPPPAVPSVEAASDLVLDNEILVERLTSLRLVASLDQVVANPRPTGERLVVEGLPWLPPSRLEPLAETFLAGALSRGRLQQLVQSVVALCRELDRPVVDVIVPEQDVTLGIVQLVVLVGHLGEVRVEGNRWLSSEFLSRQIRLRPGEAVQAEPLLRDLAWINENPFRQADLVFARGQQLGETDLILRVRDRRPQRLYAGYEDTGNAATGLGRAFAGVNFGHLWQRDHQANYQFTTAPEETRRLQAHSASYILPLPRWRHSVSVFGSWGRTRTEALDLFGLTGTSWQAGWRHQFALPTWREYTQKLSWGIDFKRSNNDLAFGGTAIYGSSAEVVQGVLNYSGQYAGRTWASNGALTLSASPGGLSARNHASDFGALRDRADPRYLYARLDLEHTQRLVHGASLVANIIAQYSTERLLPSEQLGLGGFFSVRGYDGHIVSGDHGIAAQVELRSPARKWPGWPRLDLQALGFLDAGWAWTAQTTVHEESRRNLASAGLGLRLAVSGHAAVKLDYGWQLERLRGTDPGRVHFSAILSY